MALRSAVTPGNNAFAGGTLTRAGQPTAVSGSLGNPGASGFTSPGVPAILSARNNQGSNVRIPYARVVPLHAKDALPVRDLAMVGTGNKTAYEYDGLESGELAWCLGKQFVPRDGTLQALEYSGMAAEMPRTAPPGTNGGVLGSHEVPHSQMNGHGPDRAQRLAYTAWVESHFRERVGRQTIDLKGFNVFEATPKVLDSEIAYWATHGAAGGDMFAMPDLAYIYQTPTSNTAKMPLQIANDAAMPQGLFVMERGPFLRSIGADHRPVSIEAMLPDGTAFISPQTVDRHIGSDLAQKALEVCLKTHGVFNWVPDGICLSKYETGPNGQADAEMDARAAQLFNVAVQGPAVTKTWTHDPKLQCMPMDKVFMLVVGDLSYTLDDDGAAQESVKTLTADLWKLLRTYSGSRTTREGMTPQELNASSNAFRESATKGAGDRAREEGNTAVEAAFKKWVGKAGTVPADGLLDMNSDAWDTQENGDGILLYEQLIRDKPKDPALQAVRARAEYLWSQYRTKFGYNNSGNNPVDKLREAFDRAAAAVRNGKRGVKQAKLSNLRLMRATSSFLAQYSHYKGGIDSTRRDVRESRCGLPIYYDEVKKSGGGSYIVGGWCIGTVLDSAASRSVFNNVVRTAPASMALNISVNIEWWNADKLYQHYQDKEAYVADSVVKTGTVAQRDTRRAAPSVLFSPDYDPEAGPGDTDFERGWDLRGLNEDAGDPDYIDGGMFAPAPGDTDVSQVHM